MNGISKLIKTIKELKRKNKLNDQLFFRGQRENDILLPSLLRKDLSYFKENNLYCDAWIMDYQDFKEARNSWEVLGIMQHYGIPTRLLDWSRSLLNAVFFSFADCLDCDIKCHSTKKDPKQICASRGDPVIWVLDPETLHNKLYPDCGVSAFTVGIDDDKLPDYKETFIKKKGEEWQYSKGPIFIEIPWNNSRIKQQKGFFTFHYDKVLMDKICSPAITSIKIDAGWKESLLKEFEVIGINEYDIYPDLVSLSRYMRRLYEL